MEKSQLNTNGKRPVLPDTERAKKGLSLKKLWKATPMYVKNKAKDDNVVIKKLDHKKTKGGMPAIVAKAVSMELRPPRTVHTCSVIGYDKENPKLNNQRKVVVSCDCLTGDTKVLTKDGWKTILEMARPLTPGVFPVEYLVQGALVKGSYPFYKGKEKVWNIQLMNGEKVSATQDHKFLVSTPNGSLNKWVKVRDLEVGDKLLLDNHETQYSVDFSSEDFTDMYFLGVLMGDGTHFADGSPDLQLYGHKSEIADILESTTEIVRDVVEIRNGVRVKFNNRAREIMAQHSYKNKESIRIESFEQLAGYLSGLIDTDGTSYKGGGLLIRGGYYLKHIFDELVRYGFPNCRFYLERESGTPTNLGEASKDLWALSISRRSSLRLLEYLNLSHYHVSRIGELREIERERKNWVQITGKSYGGRQHVYDITVPQGNRFVVNGGVIAHNCENYCFTWEYANWTWGASKIVHSNGDPAVVRNPQNQPGLCKHLCALLTTIMEHKL